MLRNAVFGLVLVTSAFAVGCNGSGSSEQDSGDLASEATPADANDNAATSETTTADTAANAGTTEYAALRNHEGRGERGRLEHGRLEHGRGERVRREEHIGHERREREVIARREREAHERGWMERAREWRREHRWF